MGPIISLALMLILFWVLIVLPQRRRLQSQRNLVSTLEIGDDVMTTAGLYGTIVALDDEVAELEVADGVVLRTARWAIASRVVEPATDAIDAAPTDAAPLDAASIDADVHDDSDR